MNKRRIIAFLLTFSLIIGLNSKIYASESISTQGTATEQVPTEVQPTESGAEQTTVDVQTKAEKLSKLGLISGDGNGNYNLDSQLRRSEAATFIVKLLGKDAYIKENKDKYKTSGFKDVKSSDWFIPYVSYCEQNAIISGLGNGKFGPNEFISEKAFLVLVMKCLGYSSDAGDFTWETVFSTAYKLGLVKDAEYQQKTEDNKNYLRKNVVAVMYEAMTLKSKNSSLRLLQSLVNNGTIDRVTANSTGLLQDTTVCAINSVTSQNDSRISIVFNEELAPITVDNIIIYETARKSMKLAVTKIISQSNNKLIITTAKQSADKEYTIEFLNVADKEGNIDKKLSSIFKGYKVSDIKSDLFKISRVENLSSNEIKIYFTHPVNGNMELPSCYQIYENDQLFVEGKTSTLKVKALESESNAVSITLYNSVVLNPNNEYKVKLAGSLVSVYGTKLNNGSGDEASFIPLELTAEKFTVVSAYATGYNTIQINFNKTVNPTLAKQIYNYSITDKLNYPLQINQAAVIGSDGKSVGLTLSNALDKTKIYNILINRLTDIDRQEEIVEKAFEFAGDYPDKIDLAISNVTITDLEVMTVEFNRAIDATSALRTDLYTIAEVGGVYKSFAPDSVYFSKQNPNQVKLYFKTGNALKNLTGYKLRVNPLFKDYTGVSVNRVLEYGFVPIGVSNAALSITRAAIISDDTILVKFAGKEIALDSPNASAQNYTLEYQMNGETYKKIPIAVTYIDNTTAVLKFDLLDTQQVYTLKCGAIKSYAGDIVSMNDLKCIVTIGQ